MNTLQEAIAWAEEKKVAIGHFNISNVEALHAIAKAGRDANLPVIIGVSEGERDFLGVQETRALVDVIKKEYNQPLFLNADHTYSFERIKEVIDAGYDSVIFDGAKLPFDENVAIAKQSVEYARASGRNVLVESELGYIGMSSKLLDAIPEGVSLDNLTTADEAKRFVLATGVDLFAPSVGNIHGMLTNAPEPKLHIERIAEIREATGKPLVLHGGSGNSKEDFLDAIKAGIRIVHINTELRLTFKTSLEESLKANANEIAPYKFLAPTVDAMYEFVLEKIKLFASA